ncbi:alpha/beta hydrolase-fold protein [Ignavibacteria bacterium 4148-Me]
MTKKLNMLCIILSIVFLFNYKADSSPAIYNPSEIKSVKIFSENVRDTFVIDISLPESYFEHRNQSFPVLYMTDGYWRRGQHNPIHEMAKKENIRELIIVGIGYPDSYNPNSIRVRDLIVRADFFLDFIIKELIPYIDKNYRTNSERTLWGSSFGGFFGMYVLFNYAEKTKGIFQNYIIASPAAKEKTYYKGEYLDLFALEKILYSKTKEIKANLYITVGGNEEPVRFLNPFKELIKILEERDYKNFYMKSFINPGKDHYTVWEPTLYEGIRLFLSK